jgi:hypothetical protein
MRGCHCNVDAAQSPHRNRDGLGAHELRQKGIYIYESGDPSLGTGHVGIRGGGWGNEKRDRDGNTQAGIQRVREE